MKTPQHHQDCDAAELPYYNVMCSELCEYNPKAMTLPNLKQKGTLTFLSEDHELTIDYGQEYSWDDPFKIWFNGQLYGYKTFLAAQKKVIALIAKYNLVGA